MTDLAILSAAAAAAAPTRLDPVKLFLDADIVVQLVMVGLLLASVWVWMIVISFSVRIRSACRRSAPDNPETDGTADASLDASGAVTARGRDDACACRNRRYSSTPPGR